MKTSLLICFLSIVFCAFGQRDREVIKQIDSLNSTATIYFKNGDIVESFNDFSKSKALSQNIDDSYGIAVSNLNLGNIYLSMEQEVAAEKSYKSALKAAKQAKDYSLIAACNLSLGNIYKNKKAYGLAISYFESALNVSSDYIAKKQDELKKQEVKALFDALIGLSESQIANNELDAALMNLLRAEEKLQQKDLGSYSKGYFNYTYGLYYTKKELYNTANSKFGEAISVLEKDGAKDLELLSNAYEQLSLSSAKDGDSDQAYIALLKYNAYHHKLINEEKIKQSVVAKSKFQIEDYKNNAHLANIEKIEQQAANNKIKTVNLIISIALLLLFTVLITVYISYISKRKLSKALERHNKELEEARNMALKSSELKSKFISNVSHELRTPLYGVVGITSLLLNNNNLSYRDTKLLNSLKYSGDYLLNLINDILQVSKMESQKVELKNVSVNIKELLESIVNSFEYRLQETNNKIKIIIDNHVPEHVKCDSVRLSQILINLIGNSVKFTESGTIYMRVRLIGLEKEQVGLRFEVEDTGVGIPKEKFDAIFDNFSQLEDKGNFNYQGTGLGLSITKKLIELFNSKIELESEVGVGTKFSFNVDFEVDSTAKPSLGSRNEKQKSLSIQGKPYKILVAEDNKINQIVTKNLLLKQNYKCVMVQNGQQALDKVRSEEFDLILMDINMPIMNGSEATLAIRQFNQTIPIIALTAADVLEVKEEFKDIGYNDVITKPFDNYEFFQIISANIENSKHSVINFNEAS
ncbi:response regulator [Flavobacteriaceae bacterium XHP0103]|uniref:ATP-binding protein n=1 Tax=Marixanthotalea marina TaxID=2844359 RepID=UPI002989BFB0|nr:ATP-binding protein [Marixanthotalea marina]MBU3821908.1 response regulator [Marixanthotalea marina]